MFIQLNAFGQTAWVRAKHELYSSAAAQYSAASNYYNPDGNLVVTSPFYAGGLYLYNEYGVTDNFSVIASMPVFKIQGYATTNKVLGLGDLLLGVKVGLFQDVFPISYSAEFELPTGTAELLAVNNVNAFETINLPTGDGEFNIHNKLAISHSFHPFPVYISGFVDYNWRSQYKDFDFNNQLIGGFEFGFETPSKVWFIVKANAQSTQGSIESVTDFSRGEGTNFSFLQLETVIPLPNNLYFGGRVGLYSDLAVDRTNIYSAPVFGLSLAYKGKIKQ